MPQTEEDIRCVMNLDVLVPQIVFISLGINVLHHKELRIKAKKYPTLSYSVTCTHSMRIIGVMCAERNVREPHDDAWNL